MMHTHLGVLIVCVASVYASPALSQQILEREPAEGKMKPGETVYVGRVQDRPCLIRGDVTVVTLNRAAEQDVRKNRIYGCIDPKTLKPPK